MCICYKGDKVTCYVNHGKICDGLRWKGLISAYMVITKTACYDFLDILMGKFRIIVSGSGH